MFLILSHYISIFQIVFTRKYASKGNQRGFIQSSKIQNLTWFFTRPVCLGTHNFFTAHDRILGTLQIRRRRRTEQTMEHRVIALGRRRCVSSKVGTEAGHGSKQRIPPNHQHGDTIRRIG